MPNKGEWSIKIIKARNGYILTWWDELDTGELAFQSEVVGENDEEDEQEAMMQLLLKIKEFFGVFYSKHNKSNVIVELKEKECA